MQQKKVHARNKMRKQNLDFNRRHKAEHAYWLEFRSARKAEEKRRNKWLKIRKFFGLVRFKEYSPLFALLFLTLMTFILFLCGIAVCVLGLFNDPYHYGGIGIQKVLLGCFMMWLFGKLFYCLCRISWSIIVESFKKRAKKDGKS